MDQDRRWEDLEKEDQGAGPKLLELSDYVHLAEMEHLLHIKVQNSKVMAKSAELLEELCARN